MSRLFCKKLNNMPLPKGTKSNNPGGRPKGSPNKDTAKLRGFLTTFIKKNSKKLQEDFDQLEPKDRVAMFEKLLKYALPSLSSVSGRIDFNQLSEPELDKIINKILSNNDTTATEDKAS
jgi:hypothetical protein